MYENCLTQREFSHLTPCVAGFGYGTILKILKNGTMYGSFHQLCFAIKGKFLLILSEHTFLYCPN